MSVRTIPGERGFSLRLKMIVGIGLILAVIILGYAVAALRLQAIQLRETAVREAELIGSVADRAISIAMESGKSDESQRLIERMGSEGTKASIRIIDTEGTVLRSSDPGEIGRRLQNRELPPGNGKWLPVWDDTGTTVGIFKPISNAPNCYACHARDQRQLGVLNVRLPLSTAGAHVSHQLGFMILSGVIGLLAAGVMIGFLFTLLVGRRIDRLSGTMRLVEAGDLTARVPVRNTDELGRLGSSFNTMVARMSELQRQQADRHAEELRQAEKVASLGKMAAIGLITAGIAHELNNPLNNIGITAEALVKGFETYPEREKIRMLGQVRTQVVRASAIIANLLDFTRSDSKAFGPLSVKKALESAIGLIGNELRLAGVDVRLDLPEDLPEINGSFRDLQQVFLNLFLNSVQSMPAGGTIEARATLDHGFIQIEVADTGSGIAPENVDKVFVPFFTTKEPGKGTGLGLSVSYGIIQKHRGSIAVKSELGKGTRFSIALPVAPRASGSAPGAER